MCSYRKPKKKTKSKGKTVEVEKQIEAPDTKRVMRDEVLTQEVVPNSQFPKPQRQSKEAVLVQKTKAVTKVKKNVLSSQDFLSLVGKSGIEGWNEDNEENPTESNSVPKLSELLKEEPLPQQKDEYDLDYDKGRGNNLSKYSS